MADSEKGITAVSSQPEATVPMPVVVGGDRNASNRPIGPDGQREWSFGILDFTSRCDLCLWSWACPCVVYGKNKQRLRHLQQQGAPLSSGGERYSDYCSVYTSLLFTGYAWIMQIPSRTEIRERYGIRGDVYTDCWCSAFCRPCALTQERREIELEEGSFR